MKIIKKLEDVNEGEVTRNPSEEEIVSKINEIVDLVNDLNDSSLNKYNLKPFLNIDKMLFIVEKDFKPKEKIQKPKEEDEFQNNLLKRVPWWKKMFS